MKMHQFFFLPLLFLSGFLAAESISPNERKLRKAKLPKIRKENSVLLLKKSNFDRALKETKYLLVEFCEYQLCLCLILAALQSTADAGARRFACSTVALSSDSPCSMSTMSLFLTITIITDSFLEYLSTGLLHKTDTK